MIVPQTYDDETPDTIKDHALRASCTTARPERVANERKSSSVSCSELSLPVANTSTASVSM